MTTRNRRARRQHPDSTSALTAMGAPPAGTLTIGQTTTPEGRVEWQLRQGDRLIDGGHRDRRSVVAALTARLAEDLAVVAAAQLAPAGPAFTAEFLEGEETRDGGGYSRVIEPGATSFDRPMPLPLMATTTTSWGHDGAELVGVITQARRDGDARVVLTGAFDTSERALEIARMVGDGVLTRHSPDLGDDETESECLEYRDDNDGWGPYCAEYQVRFVSAVLLGTTILPFPALDSATITLDAGEGLDDDASEDEDAVAASAVPADGERLSLVAAARQVVVAAAPAPASVARPTREALPAAWFDDPQLTGPTAPIVEESGRTYGHIATWFDAYGAPNCHIGFAEECITPPRSETGYAHFHTGGHVPLDNGTRIRVGHLTVGTGHAPDRGVTAMEAAAHYDNTGAAVADVRVGEDEHGIWFAGAIRPDADDWAIWALEVSALSGDWRRFGPGGSLELVAALAVNVPGFPVPETRLVRASGECTTLIAAGVRQMALVASAQRPAAPAMPDGGPVTMAAVAELQARLDRQDAELRELRAIAMPLRSLAVDRLAERIAR